MLATLGEAEFKIISFWSGFEGKESTDYAEHALIEGKPLLQWVGDGLDTVNITLSLHADFCDPAAEMDRLRAMKRDHAPRALVFGNGIYHGRYVLTNIDTTLRRSDASGGLLGLEARLTLREHVAPVAPEEVKNPPALARSQPATGVKKPGVRRSGPAAPQTKTETNKDGFSVRKIVRQ